MDNVVNFQINFNGSVFAGVGKLRGDFTQLVNVVGEVDKSINTTFNSLKDKISNINLTSIITQVKEVSTAISSMSMPGIDFGQGMADLSSITGTIGNDLEELGKTARKTGRESGLGAAEAIKAFTTIASQIETDDIGLEGLKVLQAKAITLAQASGMPLNDAANALAGTINQFGYEALEAERVINVLAAGSKAGGAEIDDLAESFKVVGSQAAIAGVSLEETAGALEILSKNNIKGSEAGTHLRNIILSLQTVFGADLKSMTLTEALDQLKPKMEDATFMSQNFGRMSMASAQFLIKNADAIGEMTEQVTGTSTAYEQAAVRTDTVAQMMARCRAEVDDLKIGFFEVTGAFGGYATIIGEQAVTIAQLLPLLTLMAKGISAVTSAAKLQAIWAGICKIATIIWTGVQWAFNAALWACPLTWIIMAIIALIGIIIMCVTKVEGWGKQWESITTFMKLCGKIFIESFKLAWTSLVNGIMNGLDRIRLGWYQFRKAVGMGDESENQAMIDEIRGNIERRKQEVLDGKEKINALAEEAKKALTWELKWKKGDEKEEVLGQTIPSTQSAQPAIPVATQGVSGTQLNLTGKGGKGSGKGSGSGSGSSMIDLDKIIPNLKGSTSYSSVMSRLSHLRTTSIAAAASVAMPITAAATAIPERDPLLDPKHTEYRQETDRRNVSMTKFCDTLQIHIANTDNKGQQQIRKEIEAALNDFFEDYG